ncbi:hypothetical protein M0R45_027074 [Rubus argutus]|uniref:Uncharacterized protein n=1 Tax=Rubus argutus TaxID=59490 RepID=A0AAW1X1X3_RUBAR
MHDPVPYSLAVAVAARMFTKLLPLPIQMTSNPDRHHSEPAVHTLAAQPPRSLLAFLCSAAGDPSIQLCPARALHQDVDSILAAALPSTPIIAVDQAASSSSIGGGISAVILYPARP